MSVDLQNCLDLEFADGIMRRALTRMRLICLPAMTQDKEGQDLHPTQDSGTTYLTQICSILGASADRHSMVSAVVKMNQKATKPTFQKACLLAGIEKSIIVQRSCSGTHSCRKVLCRTQESLLL